MIVFDAIRFLSLAIVIGYAAWQDHKNTIRFKPDAPTKLSKILQIKQQDNTIVEGGEVSNKTWLYLPFGFLLTITSVYLYPEILWQTIISISATALLLLFLFYVVGGMGGADVKAGLTVAVCLPLSPITVFHLMYPLIVILFACLMAFLAGKIKHTENVRLLPFMFLSLFLALVF